MRPRFREGEIVRVARAPGSSVLQAGEEAVVDEIAGPNEEGTGWVLTLRAPGRDSLLLDEGDLEPTGLEEDEQGERVPLGAGPSAEDLQDRLELRLFTEITDGIEAVRVAESIEHELSDLLGGVNATIEAERHWSEPYNYELWVEVTGLGDPVEALQILAEAGGEGWLACRDDGWRCDLVWSSTRDPDAMLVVPEVHAAEVSFVPWSSPARRPESRRPLVSVPLLDDLDNQAGDEEP